MARTTFTCTPAAGQSSATFMAHVNQLHSELLGVGFVATSDTGQLDLGSSPTLANSSLVGFRLYELNDSLSGTHPIYLRIEFWTMNNLKLNINMRIGKGTDGAGALTGAFGGSNLWASAPSQNTQTVLHTAYLSRGEGYFVLLYAYPTSTANGVLSYYGFLAFERARNLDGSYRGDALFLSRHGAAAMFSYSAANWDLAYTYADGSTLGNLDPGTLNLPTTFSGNVGIGGGIVPLFYVPFVFAPGVDPWQPTLFATLPKNDNPGTPFDVEVYGEDQTYYGPSLGASVATQSPVWGSGTRLDMNSSTLAWRWDA